MKVTTEQNNMTDSLRVIVDTPREYFVSKLPIAIFEEVVKIVAEKIADKVILEKGQEIFESISPEAIANLTVAYTGNSIKDMLDKKLPDKIVENIKTEVYQRGFFGGITRVK